MTDLFFHPMINVVVEMGINTNRSFEIKDVVFSETNYGKKKVDVYYVDAEPPLIGGKYPMRKGSSAFVELQEEINNTFKSELYFVITGIEEDVIHLECTV